MLTITAKMLFIHARSVDSVPNLAPRIFEDLPMFTLVSVKKCVLESVSRLYTQRKSLGIEVILIIHKTAETC